MVSSFRLWLSELHTLLQELISIKSLLISNINIYNIVFTLTVRYDLNCVKNAVKL